MPCKFSCVFCESCLKKPENQVQKDYWPPKKVSSGIFSYESTINRLVLRFLPVPKYLVLPPQGPTFPTFQLRAQELRSPGSSFISCQRRSPGFLACKKTRPPCNKNGCRTHLVRMLLRCKFVGVIQDRSDCLATKLLTNRYFRHLVERLFFKCHFDHYVYIYIYTNWNLAT